MMTNQHYRQFLRLNNRKRSHRVEDFVKYNYPIIEISKDCQPLHSNKNLMSWCTSNFNFAWVHDGYELIVLSNQDHATFFQLTWGGEIINYKYQC